MSRPDVIVLGGGIIGLACARELAGRGLAVELIERLYTGAGATYAAAGMLAPLSEIPEPGPFLDTCLEARDLWRQWGPELEEESGVEIDYDRSGAILLWPPEVAEAAAGDLLELARSLGESAEPLSGDELHRLVPDLAPDVASGVHLTGEHRVDNRRVIEALDGAVSARGVEVHEGYEVERVSHRTGVVRVEGAGFTAEAPRLLVTAGAWSGMIEGLPTLPIRPVRGQMFAVEEVGWPHLGSVRAGSLYAVGRAGGRLVVGATVEEAGFREHTTPEGLGELFDACRRWFPGLGGKPVIETWSGLRPGSPDGRPIVGRLAGEAEIWAATGHYRNGILLAPWTARVIGREMTR